MGAWSSTDSVEVIRYVTAISMAARDDAGTEPGLSTARVCRFDAASTRVGLASEIETTSQEGTAAAGPPSSSRRAPATASLAAVAPTNAATTDRPAMTPHRAPPQGAASTSRLGPDKPLSFLVVRTPTCTLGREDRHPRRLRHRRCGPDPAAHPAPRQRLRRGPGRTGCTGRHGPSAAAWRPRNPTPTGQST